jgi:hypothetical protein
VPLPGGITLASAPAVVDGTVILGAGAGERSDDPMDEGNVASRIPQSVSALCVAGTAGCDARPDPCDAAAARLPTRSRFAQAQDAVDASCPCAAFDGSKGQRHELRALRAARAARSRALRPAAPPLLNAACGTPGHHRPADDPGRSSAVGPNPPTAAW